MSRTVLMIVIVIVGGATLAVWYVRTAHANRERNLRISNLIASKYYTQHPRGTSWWITTVINISCNTTYSVQDVESALRFLLTLHRVRVIPDSQNPSETVWVAVDLEP